MTQTNKIEQVVMECGHIAVVTGSQEHRQHMRKMFEGVKCAECAQKKQLTCWVIYFPDLRKWKGAADLVDNYHEAMKFNSNRLAANYAFNYSKLHCFGGTSNFRIQYRENF